MKNELNINYKHSHDKIYFRFFFQLYCIGEWDVTFQEKAHQFIHFWVSSCYLDY